jgi:hypothetical protein
MRICFSAVVARCWIRVKVQDAERLSLENILDLTLTNTTLNVQSYIGSIVLGGIVVNNAILLVDYANLLRLRDKMPLREAIEEAGRCRLRPPITAPSGQRSLCRDRKRLKR